MITVLGTMPAALCLNHPEGFCSSCFQPVLDPGSNPGRRLSSASWHLIQPTDGPRSVPSPGSLPLLGQYLTSYWEQKKLMAPGCEPLAVRRMMDVLAPHVHGQSLAGAGGGGFLCLLTKEPRQKEALEAVLAKTEVLGGWGTLTGGDRSPPCGPPVNQGYRCKPPWLCSSSPASRGSEIHAEPTNTSYPLLLGPRELQRPPGRSGHAGPEPAAAGD